MSAKQNPAADDDAATGRPDESVAEHSVRTPDEDGPHDIPDDEVIEKTLPSGRIG